MSHFFEVRAPVLSPEEKLEAQRRFWRDAFESGVIVCAADVEEQLRQALAEVRAIVAIDIKVMVSMHLDPGIACTGRAMRATRFG